MRDRDTVSGHDQGRDERSIGGRYRIGAVLAADRRTRLHEALALGGDARPAVARVARRAARDEIQEALRAEGELLRQVRHPNVAKGYAVGEEDSVGAYLVRERIEGVDLREALRRSGPHSPERARIVALSLARALRALERAGSTACLEPEDVWIEEGTDRLVVVSAMPSDVSARARTRASAELVADVLIGCGRGELPADPRDRARVRVEVVRARSTGDRPTDVPPELGEIIEICVAGGAGVDAPSPSDLALRLDGVRFVPSHHLDGTPGAVAPPRVTEIRTLLAVSDELGLRPDALGVSSALLERAEFTPEDERPDLEAELGRAAVTLRDALTRAIEERAQVLEAEWTGFEAKAGPLASDVPPKGFEEALRVVRDEVGDARFAEAQGALGRARAQLESARDVARTVAQQRARDGVDVLVRRLDALEENSPGSTVDPALEPRQVRADAQALLEEGRFADALQRVEAAVAEVERRDTERESSALRAAARELADRAVAMRRNHNAVAGSSSLDAVERTLSHVVTRLGRGDLAGARHATEEAAASLKRLDWEWGLTAPDTEAGTVDGLAEIDELRQTAAALARGEKGRALRAELARRLEAFERATHGVWADSIARLRDLVRRSAWSQLGRALGDVREQMLAAAAPTEGVAFHPSPELAEVLRILAEAERDAPPASASDAARLATLRRGGEAMLARLDADRAREARPDLVDQLVERCAAAADAERRGDHARAARELDAANGILAELLEATGAPPGAPASVAGRPAVAGRGAVGERSLSLDARTALAGLGGRAWLGLAVLLLAVGWWIRAPVPSWTTPGDSGGPSAARFDDAARTTPVPTGLFPRIAASMPAAASLPRVSLPHALEIAVTSASGGPAPDVVWWAGDRVVARGRATLVVARVPRGVWRDADFVRVTVGDGTRPEQTRVWSLR